MRQSLLFAKVAGLRPANMSKKKLWHRCFPVNIAKFVRTPLGAWFCVFKRDQRRMLRRNRLILLDPNAGYIRKAEK